jgi:hypothetical protein
MGSFKMGANENLAFNSRKVYYYASSQIMSHTDLAMVGSLNF